MPELLNESPQRPALLALYGTLMPGVGALERLGLGNALTPLGACAIGGALWDLGPYPGLLPSAADSASCTRAELFLAQRPAQDLPVLDEYEGFPIDAPAEGLFVRRWTPIDHPAHSAAWVYWFNQPLDLFPDARPIAHGDWRRWSQERNQTGARISSIVA
ncbi:gamma-glutamylcyclotransferase family protein [Magnetofaba australis]|uniref:Gamma-glutamylcyclotransferase AIG2-like domain-containing protein n=1 Tax=Magnetofaba australis IT-1 TaxID=1434232 RepID=A0A1Y2K120_9PROT|nr:gamma-glutamylcyclotransferase family protein [Magnetofaba australis]OSM01698.1 hypothetical protein MAIT1_01718 [Magnetofaba australis IT-1]